MTGCVIIVTGANSGIGFRAAQQLCEAGNDVILACRNEDSAKAALEKIFKRSPNALATFMQCDLADLSSVRKFVEDFHATGKKLHVLVNNAGVLLSKDNRRQFSPDNFELTMATNHMGPFLLTHLLLDDLKKAAAEGGDCRIVNVTSNDHDAATKRTKCEALDTGNFFLEKDGTYNYQQSYRNSKLAMVLTTYVLSRQLGESGVTVNTVCPGLIPTTGLCRHAGGGRKFFFRYILGTMLQPVVKPVKTLEQGAKAIIDLVTSEDYKGVTGKYFKDFVEAKSSDESLNEDLQKEVYELSARYCHLEGYDPLDAPPPPVEEPKSSPKKSKKEKNVSTIEEKVGPSEEEATEEIAKDIGDKSEDGIKFADEDEKAEDTANDTTEDTAKETENEKEIEKVEDVKDTEKEEIKEEEVKDSGKEVIKEEEVKDSGKEVIKEEEVKDSGKEVIKEEEVKDSGKEVIQEEEIKDSGKEEIKEDGVKEKTENIVVVNAEVTVA